MPGPSKGWFFDSAAVLARVDAATRKAMAKAGAFVRTRARSLLKYRKKPSAAGTPPSVHRAGSFTRETTKKDGSKVRRSASPLKELLYFAYDPASRTVVVGPAEFRAARGRARPAAGTVPGLVERGGTATVVRHGGTLRLTNRTRGGRFEVVSKGGKKVLRYKPRPFMAKAMDAERAKFPGLFRGSVGG